MGIREMKGAGIVVDTCAGLKAGERAVVITDTEKMAIAEYVAAACWERGSEPVMVVMLPRKADGEEPPASAAEALKHADVIFAVTDRSLYHTVARKEACATGARFVNMPDYSMDMLVTGGLYEDFPARRIVADRVAGVFSGGSSVRVTTVKGTDIQFSIQGRKGTAGTGISDKPGSVAAPPNIEAAVAPVEGTANGKVVVDGSIVLPRLGVLENEVVLEVKDGVVTGVSGGKEAAEFKAQMDAAADPLVWAIAELGFGLNTKARLSGRMLDDEAALGTAHFGLGSNYNMGGTIQCSRHTDVVLTKATVTIDGRVVMQEGMLLV